MKVDLDLHINIALILLIHFRIGGDLEVGIDTISIMIEADVIVMIVTVTDPLRENPEAVTDLNLDLQGEINIRTDIDLVQEVVLETTLIEIDLVLRILDKNIEIVIVSATLNLK